MPLGSRMPRCVALVTSLLLVTSALTLLDTGVAPAAEQAPGPSMADAPDASTPVAPSPAAPSPVAPATPAQPHRSDLAARGAVARPKVSPLATAKQVDPFTDGLCPQHTGRVRLNGPAGLVLTGLARCSSQTWRVVIDGGSGVVGGMTIPFTAFSGSLAAKGGVVTGTVTVNLPAFARVVQDWQQGAHVVITPRGARWDAQVSVVQRQDESILRLAGPLRPDGGYQLTASGSVKFARTAIPLSGSYRSGATPTWSITGAGHDGSSAGASIQSPRIAMTQRDPHVTGSATAALAEPLRMSTPVALRIHSAATWSAEAHGGSSAVWRDPSLPFVRVATKLLHGTIGMREGKTAWSLTAPMTFTDERLTVGGEFAFLGPDTWRMTPTQARGSVMGYAKPNTFIGTWGSITVDRGRANGRMKIVSSDEMLLDMPVAWRTNNAYFIGLRKNGGPVFTTQRYSIYAMTDGRSRLQLLGPIPHGTGFRLTARGHLNIDRAPVPFEGSYESAGYAGHGAPHAKPVLDLSADIDKAPRGYVPLDGGAAIASGTLTFADANAQATRLSAPMSTSDETTIDGVTVTVTVTGMTEVQITTSDDFTINCSYTYEDSDNWTLTAAGNYDDTWQPYEGFAIPDVGFHGTIDDSGGVENWAVTTDPITWTGMMTGAKMTTSFTLSNQCPDTLPCPTDDTDAVYVSSNSAAVDFSNIPDVTAQGAFTTDLTWFYWTATSAPATFSYDGFSITINQPTVTIFQDTYAEPYQGLELPDLSAEGGDNGIQVQVCGQFQVAIPELPTEQTGGCAEWTSSGFVLGQVNTGGNFAPGSYNNISIGGGLVNGFGWTNLPGDPSVIIDDVTLALPQGRTSLTATLAIPGDVMEAFGTDTTVNTQIPATGWFDSSGNFYLDATIEVGLVTATATLDSIDVEIGRDGTDYTLGLDAVGSIKVDGHHYPTTAYVGASKSDDASSITVSLTVQGNYSSQSLGAFDDSGIMTEGDFEPPNATLIDGSFDGQQLPNALSDGTFENAGVQANLIGNPGFEDSIEPELLPAEVGTFDGAPAGSTAYAGGNTGNFLDNMDLEDTQTLINADFEGYYGSQAHTGVLGWTASSSTYTLTLIDDTTVPSSDAGSYAMQVTSTSSSTGSGTSIGAFQEPFMMPPIQGTTYTAAGWVRAGSTSAARAQLSIVPQGCSDAAVSATATAQVGSWTYLTVNYTPGFYTCSGMSVYVAPTDAKGSIVADSLTLAVSSSTASVNEIDNAYLPFLFEEFNNANAFSTASDVATISDGEGGNYLKSDGCGSWWIFNTNSYAFALGDFDASVKVMWPSGGSGSRDIADIGFWLNGSGASATGYMFRLETANSDGGFYQVKGNVNFSRLSGDQNAPNAAYNTWYDVHLTAVGNVVTVTVTDLTDNSTFWNYTITVPAASTTYEHSGRFGQVEDNACTSQGSRWDDFRLRSGQTQAWVYRDPKGAHSGDNYLEYYGRATNWTSMYSTGEAPTAGQTYSYSAWVKAPSGTVSGSLVLETESTSGVALESSTTSFTATSTWTQVTATLPIKNSGHTDIRAGFANMPNGANLYVDDQLLQMIPWLAATSGSNTTLPRLWTTTDDSDNSSLNFQDVGGGSTIAFSPGAPASTVQYVVTADVMATSNTAGTLEWVEQNQTVSKTFTATPTWQTVSVTVTSKGGTSAASILFANASKGTYVIDNVTLHALLTSSAQSSTTLGALPIPAGWVGSATTHGDPTNAYDDTGYLAVGTNGASAYYEIDDTIVVGSTYTASLWIKAIGGSSSAVVKASTVNNGSTLESDSVTVTANGSYQFVTVTLPVTKAGADFLELRVTNNGANTLAVDDVQFGLLGLGFNDPWAQTNGSSGQMFLSILDDSAVAHSGDNYLQITDTGASGTAYVATSYAPPTSAGQHTVSAWVRSATGQSVSGFVGVAFSPGSTKKTAPFTLSGSTWHQVFVTLPTSSSSGTTLSTQIGVTTVGGVLLVDDVESRDGTPFGPWQAGQSVNLAIVENAAESASGPNYATFTASGAGAGIFGQAATDPNGNAISVTKGDSFTMSAYVRSTSGAPLSGTFALDFGNGSSTVTSAPAAQTFTATSGWQPVSFTFTAQGNATSVQPVVALAVPGQLDIDSLVVAPVRIVQNQPWSAVGSGVTWGVYDDPTKAYDGSLGLMELTPSSASATGVQKQISASASAGQVYTASAWVRSPSGKGISAALQMQSVGGTAESAQTPIQVDDTWQLVTVRMPLSYSHTGFKVSITSQTSGVELDVDNVVVQQNIWQLQTGSTGAQTIINDGTSAEEGTGYLLLTNGGSGNTAAYASDSETFSAGVTQTLTAYVRSDKGSPVAGTLELGPVGGTAAVTSFTAGADWTQVTVKYTPSTTLSALQMLVRNTQANAGLDIDTVMLTATSGTPTAPLDHPNTGYSYLWDDAFGIPGAHLWSVTAQVIAAPDAAGLGIGATMYFDPTAMPSIMDGTDWIYGEMAVQLTYLPQDSCLSFTFDGQTDDGDSYVSIADGVLKADEFAINIAPSGCTIGPYAVPMGASMSFDALVGDATINFDLAMGLDANDSPYFQEDLGLTNLDYGGIDFKTATMSIYASDDSSSVSLSGDFVLPMGEFNGYFDMVASTDGVQLVGDADLSNWTFAGGGFDVQEFDFYLSMDVPFGSSCGSFSTDDSGIMSIAERTSLTFTGELAVNCGNLETLTLDWDYSHGSVTEIFDLSYDSSTGMLAGEVVFDFEREFSWKFLSHRYRRHPKIEISLAYSMDTNDPGATSEATLDGSVSVSSGSGSVDCTFSGDGSDDQCSLAASVTVLSHTYHWSDTW